ncbi:MAG TPA: hypothetical protein VJ875_25460 [Pyrinomonadaceae bacterium]|nr:hypothetical protein [Pyrinomonadaceae bacterium]
MFNDSPKDCEETPHTRNTLKQRAQAVIDDRSIDAQTRAVIRYGLETDDPWLAEIVRGVDAGKTIEETIEFWQNTSEKRKSTFSHAKAQRTQRDRDKLCVFCAFACLDLRK